MAETQKDLTGLIELSEGLKQSGQEVPMPEGLIFEETPVDQIDAFESLESFAQANPMPEPATDFPITPSELSESHPTDEAFAPIDSPLAPSDTGDSPPPTDTDFAMAESNFPTTDSGLENQPPTSATPSNSVFQSFDTFTPVETLQAQAEETKGEPEALPELPEVPRTESVQSAPSEDITEEAIAVTLPQPETAARKVPAAIQAAVPAAFPFTLLIDGPLTPREKDKLLDLVTRESLGIREIDLEPQFQGNKILIPRISEFAGVLIIQTLREALATVKFGPSEEIYTAQGTTDDTQPMWTPAGNQTSKPTPSDPQHPADAIPVTTERELPNLKNYTAIDTLSASGTLTTFSVEAESTPEYDDLLNALQRELKYKARRRSAEGIIHFRIQLTPLTSPSRYRLTVMGLAIKSR